MTYRLDPADTRLQFSVRHMMITTVKGTFSDVTADVDLDPSHLKSARVSAQIGTASVSTGDRLRDDYLRGKDFFNPSSFPHMIYRSTSVRPRGKKVSVTGLLQIREIERQLILTGSWEDFGNRLRFHLSGELDREAYNLVFNGAVETVSVVVGKKVGLDLTIGLSRD